MRLGLTGKICEIIENILNVHRKQITFCKKCGKLFTPNKKNTDLRKILDPYNFIKNLPIELWIIEYSKSHICCVNCLQKATAQFQQDIIQSIQHEQPNDNILFNINQKIYYCPDCFLLLLSYQDNFVYMSPPMAIIQRHLY